MELAANEIEAPEKAGEGAGGGDAGQFDFLPVIEGLAGGVTIGQLSNCQRGAWGQKCTEKGLTSFWMTGMAL